MAEALDRQEPSLRQRRGLLEGQSGRLGHQRRLGHAGVLGEGPEPRREEVAEDLVTGREARHVVTDRFDRPGDVGTQHSGAWAERPRETNEERPPHVIHVGGVH